MKGVGVLHKCERETVLRTRYTSRKKVVLERAPRELLGDDSGGMPDVLGFRQQTKVTFHLKCGDKAATAACCTLHYNLVFTVQMLDMYEGGGRTHISAARARANMGPGVAPGG